MIRVTGVCAAASSAMAPCAADRSLLGYPIRHAAALELLYGGVRVQHLVQKPFPLRRICSEKLPSPSQERERADLELEMYAPHDLQGYGGVHMHMQRHIASQTALDATDSTPDSGFDLSSFFGTAHHPDRHHTSSLPYSGCDTNNVLGLRLYPINMSVHARTESVRVRTEDCLRRLRSARDCAARGAPLCHPLPASRKTATGSNCESNGSRHGTGTTLYTPSEDNPHKPASIDADSESAGARSDDVRCAHLRGGPCHPHPSQLSLVTRLVDHNVKDSKGMDKTNDALDGTDNRRSISSTSAYALFNALSGLRHPWSGVTGRYPGKPAQYWMPLQMVKPMGHSWSPAVRSSGVRGPNMQLYQERLDQKGFGWKRKSRSLWQQDIATAGFRPKRYF